MTWQKIEQLWYESVNIMDMIGTAISEWCRLRHKDNSLSILNEEHRALVKYKMSVLSPLMVMHHVPWWRHQMETFSALLTICAGNSPVPGEFPPQRPVTQSFDVLFDLRPNKRLSKQWWGWWFETPSCPLWRQCNGFKSGTAKTPSYKLLMTQFTRIVSVVLQMY